MQIHFFLGVLACSFILVQYVLRMSNLGHYQFFPVAMIGAYALYASRKNTLPLQVKQHTNNRSISFFAFWLTLLASVFIVSLINSSFLGWLIFVAFIASTIWFYKGWDSLKALTAPLVLLLLITPLPAQMDQALVFQMQRVASYMASNILDRVGVLHNLQGVVISVIDMQFLAEEACSGIRSLFSSICGIFFFGAYLRYAWWRHIINIIQTILWVLIGNAVRIASVVVAYVWFDIDLATGLIHSALGLLTFFLIVGLALSTDRLLNGIFNGRGIQKNHDVESKESDLPASQPVSTNLGVWKYPLIIASGLMGLVSVRLLTLPDGGIAQAAMGSLVKPTESELPPAIQGWNKVAFREVSRNADDVQGEHSSIWSYSQNNVTLQLSADCEWNDFHDLTYCYSGLGWKCDTEHRYTPLADTEQIENGYSLIKLSKLTGERSLVIFSVLDRNGKVVRPPVKIGQDTSIYLKELLLNRLRALVFLPPTESIRKSMFQGPVMTFQILVPSNVTFTDDAVNEIRSFYIEAREAILKSARFQSNPSLATASK